MRKPIFKIKRSTLGTNIVIRSPFSRAWLCNITIAPKRESLSLEWLPGYTVAKMGMALTLLSILVLTFAGCADTTAPALDAKEKMVSTRNELKGMR